MTRRRDLMLEDITHCKHEPTLPVSENGEILYWLCACGREHYPEQRTYVDQCGEAVTADLKCTLVKGHEGDHRHATRDDHYP